LHKREILTLKKYTDIKGNTIIPLSLYFRNGVVKVEIGIGTGKKKYDKRQDMKKQDARREIDRALKNYN